MFYYLFLIIPLVIYLFFSVAIFYLLRRYSFGDKLSHGIMATFAVVSVVLLTLAAAAYFSVEWGNFLPALPVFNFNFGL